MPNHAPRISLSYADASGILHLWSDTCFQMVIYEHEADEGCARTHLHVLMLGCNVKEEALKRMFYKGLPDETRKGNELWSWVHDEWRKAHPDEEYNDSLITYMSKGKLRPVYSKNFPVTIVDQRTREWIEPTKPSNEKYDEYKEMLKDAVKDFDKRRPNLSEVRSWSMRWYWRRDGRLPNAGSYKRNAASVFLHLTELKQEGAPREYSFGCALEEVKNLWY